MESADNNPYLSEGSLYDVLLKVEKCQEIHFAAQKMAISGKTEMPAYVSPELLKTQVARYGSEILIAPPAHIESVFRGITTNIYLTIERLFNTPLHRSVQTVFKILQKMAEDANRPEPEFEAVWAICTYLRKSRDIYASPAFDHLNSTWTIFLLKPDVQIRRQSSPKFPVIVCVADIGQSKILSFRICLEGNEVEEAIGVAICDALVSQRRPLARGHAAVIWPVPAQLECNRQLPSSVLKGMGQLGIKWRKEQDQRNPLLYELATQWDRDLAGRILTEDQMTQTLDYFLFHKYGYSPQRAEAETFQNFYGLVGVNRDPGSQVPALRTFLPRYEVQVSKGAEVFFDGLHFESPLLAHLPGHSVELQPSPYDDSTAWTDLENEILCEAKARELRRSDGSYRRYRLERINYA